MNRVPLLSSLLLLAAPVPPPSLPPLRANEKANGYISSCDARGCLGRRAICVIYSFGAGEDRHTFYCYLDS